MNPTRNGKIARLPRSLREELNQRLHDGEQGKTLVAWLNSLPKVQSMTAGHFGGRPVREQNLTEWKQGGYQDWLALQEACNATARLADEAGGACDPSSPPLTDTLSQWLAVRYAMATRHLEGTDGPDHLLLLHRFCGDIVQLRRGDHNAQRLELDRARLATLERGSQEKQMQD